MNLPDVELAVEREMLRVALHNAGRSVPLLLLALALAAALGWQAGARLAAAGVAGLGLLAAAWRLRLARRVAGDSGVSRASAAALAALVQQLEGNALLVGLMWALATTFIYPVLGAQAATIYIVMVCGSVATAAFFMSLAGRSFLWLTLLQLGSVVGVSLLLPTVRSWALAALALAFGLTMWQAAREFRSTAQRSMRQSLRADLGHAELLRSKLAAEAANLAKSQFLATMSHEIRTPMNGVLGALDLLRHTALDNRQRRLVKTAAASGESLMGILNDVLDHSKIEAGKLTLAAAPLSLHGVASAAAALFRASAESRGLSIVLQLGDGVPDGVVGDAPRLKQVLLNLLGNGVKFTEAGSVSLRLTAVDEGAVDVAPARVHFEVADTGIGIAPELQQQVFQPFQQVDNTRSRRRGGTGLGLAISQRIVQAMGGEIRLHSEPGRGSVFGFELSLPLARELPPPARDSDFGALDQVQSLSGVVLLVEDNPVNRLIGVEMLRSFGLGVLEAEDGAQALAMVEHHDIDLVLMDIQMPVLDGYEATQRLREREARLGLARLPVVALTANAFEADVSQALDAGMDAHLAKPYGRGQLRQLLQRWL
jgi:signal transduction histidine kinase/CheY-like chemotaxis protein